MKAIKQVVARRTCMVREHLEQMGDVCADLFVVFRFSK